MSPSDAITRLEKFRAAVRNPRAFYLLRRDEWRSAAARVAEETLRALRPDGVEQGLWELACASAGRRVAADLFEGEEVGIVLSLGKLPDGTDLLNPDHFVLDGISVADVERWVELTRNKKLPDGIEKRLKKIDDQNTNLQIAWRIIYAIKNNTRGVAARLKHHIKAFMGFEVQSDAEELYPQVLIAWMDYFVPVATREWEEWLELQAELAGVK